MNLRNKNIVQVSSYYPPHLGGLEKCVQTISELTANMGINVTVLTSDIGKGKVSKNKSSNPKVEYLPTIEIAHTPISFKLISKLLSVERDSILHIHIANAFFPDIAYIIAKLRHFKYIAHYHIDVDESGIMGVFLPLYKKYVLKYILRNANKVICLTKNQKQLLIKKYNVQVENIEDCSY